MTIDCQAERLSDERLLTLLREAAAEARRRPSMKPELKRFHAEELEELKIEDMCRRGACIDLDPEAIVELARVPTEVRPVSRDTLRLVGGAA